MDDNQRIERRLKLHDLRVLISVVESGSMSKAAERLATSQPAISRAIAELEYSLGVRLLDRGPYGIEPTPYGRALIKRGVAVFDELRLGVKDLEFLSDPTAGEVRIAAALALSTGFVATIIDRLIRRHPHVICHLAVDEAPRVLRRLEEREVDLVISYLVEPIPYDLMETQFLYADPLIVVAGANNPWARRRRVTLADLADEPWAFMPPDNVFHPSYTRIFRAAKLDLPKATVVATSVLARLALVAKGQFLTITTESVFRLGGRQIGIKALPIDLAETRPVGIVTLKNRTLTPVAQLFIDCAHEVAKPLAMGKTVSAQRRRLASQNS
jgi:DNA-binding transcriptional LysR family regulator